MEKLENELGYLEFQQEVDIKQQELQKSKLVEKDEHINMIEVTEETRQAEVKQAKKEVVEEFKELHKILEKYRVKIPIKEMAEQSPYCIKFLQKLLKTIDASSEEDFISLSKECHVISRYPYKSCLMLNVGLHFQYMWSNIILEKACVIQEQMQTIWV